MCPVFLMCGGLGGGAGAALPDIWAGADSRRRERHFHAAGLAACSLDRLPQRVSRCRWAASRASSWSMRMCVRQAGGGRLRRETALPMLRGRQWGTDQRAVSDSTGLFRHSAPAKGIKTAPAVWGQTLFGFRLCLGIHRRLGVLIDGLPGHGIKIRAGGLIRCRSLGQFRGGS